MSDTIIVWMFFLISFIGTGVVSAATIYVDNDPGCGGHFPCYSNIHSAVSAATAGDTIIVRDGTYTDYVVVYKQLTIRSENGADSTIVQAANSNDHVFMVTADYVNISGFTLKGATGSGKAGITLWDGVDHSIISNNNVSNNFYGIYLLSSNNNIITNNIASSNGVGIYLLSSNNNIITNNTILKNSEGIATYSSSNNIIANNTASKNTNGIYLGYLSGDNIITNNIASNNTIGIHLHNSNNNIITNNIASNNTYYCIFLSYSNNSTITNNNITSNNSFYGVLLYNSSNNKIYLNNFMYSTNYNSEFSTNIWSSTEAIAYTYNGNQYTNYLGNYWSDYIGSDANGDGIGDTPYPIGSDADNYPLMQPFENYIVSPAPPAIYTAEEYFPRTIGYRMAYQWSNNVYYPETINENCIFTSSDSISCIWHTEHKYADGEFYLSDSSDYLFWSGYETYGHNLFPIMMYMFFFYAYMPENFLKNTFSVGDSWSGSGTFPGGGSNVYEDYTSTTYVEGVEDVTTPAGTFSCVRLRTDFTSTSNYIEGTRYIWLAKDVGIVKLEYYHADGSVTSGVLSEYGLVTPPGEEVTVTHESTVVTFSKVVNEGTTVIKTQTENPGASPPPNFRLENFYVDIITNTQYEGPITVCIDYTGKVSGDESNLRLLHWDGSNWEDVTTSLDTASNVICGQVSSLSWFGLAHYGGAVGGTKAPVNKIELIMPYILASVLIGIAGTGIYIVRRRIS